MSSSNQPSSMRQLMSPMSLLLYVIFIILGFLLSNFLSKGKEDDQPKPAKFAKLSWKTAKENVMRLDTVSNRGSYLDLDSSSLESIRSFMTHQTTTKTVRIYLASGDNVGYFLLSPLDKDGHDHVTDSVNYTEPPKKIKLPCLKYCDLQSTAFGE